MTDFEDGAGDGRVPTVVAKWREEGLVACPSNEMGCEGFIVQHVDERVWLIFEPERRVGGDVADEVARAGFTGVGDDC